MKRIPNNHPTYLLRQKLGITQSELAYLTGTSRSMVARNESGEKELNLYATLKVDYLNMCVNGVFEQQPHLHHERPPVFNVAALTPERVRHLRQGAQIKVIKTERALELFDETRANAELTLRRLAQLDITRLPGFTTDDLVWVKYVMSKLRLTLHAHTDLARLELTLTLVREQAAIAAYDAVLLNLEAENHGAEVMEGVEAMLSVEVEAETEVEAEAEAEAAEMLILDSIPISLPQAEPQRSARVIPLRSFSRRTHHHVPTLKRNVSHQSAEVGIASHHSTSLARARA